MLCPCCGDNLGLEARQCGCGARFVGSPLDHQPVKVQRFGPVMIAGLLFLTVVASSLVITKWLALAGVFAVWSAWRAMRLARSNPQEYGGYKMATSLLVVTATIGSVASGFGITYIPRYIDNLKLRQQAATEAAIRHLGASAEDYRLANGSYPDSEKFPADSMPLDYWGNPIKYESSAELSGTVSDPEDRNSTQPTPRDAQVPKHKQPRVPGFSNTNFTIRSAGPDGKMDTEDDIIMRDGIFVTNREGISAANKEARK